eukprot:TRINITY_DN15668_c0_g1_i2.p1 TRINITY_DN15668_c0_g1~~TRINITY_DN15668_c0_g1_i2.p1  ORF type:complete len:188 (-),score=8.82 TRINITY_DN15668_c0_g1_i2:70-633(-)
MSTDYHQAPDPERISAKWRFTPHDSYGILGWLETAIKGLAIISAFVSISVYTNSPVVLLTARYVIIVMLGILQIIYVGLVVLRFLDRELFAIGFSIVQALANLSIFVVSIKSSEPDQFIFVYCFLNILGELVKMMFLFLKKKEEFSVKHLPRTVLWAISIALILIYLIGFICQIYLFYVGYRNNHGR